MPCSICQGFPVPTSRFEELATSIPRHGTLYRCKACGTLFEVIAEEREVRFSPGDELRRYYPGIVDE
jgi:hypothetical protein